MGNVSNNCLICGEELEYLNQAEEMECMECHQKFLSNARCKNGHYICDECHGKRGIASIVDYCLASSGKNPVEMAMEMMDNPFIYMHGPEHHVMVGAALLTACHNCLEHGGGRDLKADLEEMVKRGSQVPGGICGLWGSCGAGISAGIFYSIFTEATPLSKESWGKANELTSRCLNAIGSIGGPRCCKRDSLTAILTAAGFVKENMGIEMELPERVVCRFMAHNAQCLGKGCPYNPGAAKNQDAGIFTK